MPFLPKLARRLGREHGFTMIELLVVVIIIAILAAVAIPVYLGIQTNAKKSTVLHDVDTTRLSVAAAIAEDKAVSSGTTTAAVGATVYNSGVSGETITVTVASDNNFTVVGSGVGGTTYTYDSKLATTSGSSAVVAAEDADGCQYGTTSVGFCKANAAGTSVTADGQTNWTINANNTALTKGTLVSSFALTNTFYTRVDKTQVGGSNGLQIDGDYKAIFAAINSRYQGCKNGASQNSNTTTYYLSASEATAYDANNNQLAVTGTANGSTWKLAVAAFCDSKSKATYAGVQLSTDNNIAGTVKYLKFSYNSVAYQLGTN